VDTPDLISTSAERFLSRAVAYMTASGPDSATSSPGPHDLDSAVLTPLATGLAVAYVVDEPQGLVFVQERHLRDAGMAANQLHQQATANLGKLCAAGLRVEKHGPVYGIFLEGNFEASLFLLESLWQRDLAHLVDKGFVVSIPARDILAFCDMESTHGVETLRQVAAHVYQAGDGLLSPRLFRVRKKNQPLPLDSTDGAAVALGRQAAAA
jgi:uncharacterized protein YtpQ (UPF0354 family)